jgi:uncharacterized protein YjbJ (UPF0337 family)
LLINARTEKETRRTRGALHFLLNDSRGITMDKDRVKGTGKEVKGAVKETLGKATGDVETEAKGKVEKNVGTAQRKVGEAKDEVRKAVKK